MKSLLSILLFVFLGSSISLAQAETKKFQVRGYLKDLHSVNFTGGDSMLQDNFLHNRLNFRYLPNQKLSFGLELRNRFFYGETKKLNPFYADLLDQENGIVDLSFPLYEDKAVFLLSAIDRIWFNYADDKWNVRIGRQRINWGLNLVWNPNDLFNVYNFSDFDCEERPGADAIRVERFLKGGMNSLEVTYSPSACASKHVGAFKYRYNKGGFDYQILGGLYRRDIALGVGWAGNIKTDGFKGELSYFHPTQNLDSIGVLSASVTYDITFKNYSYLALSIFYNSAGVDSLVSTNSSLFIGSTLSPKNLMPNTLSYFAQYTWQFNPLLTGGMAAICAQGIDFVFLTPNIGYSISNNWDIGMVAQMYFGKKGSDLGSLGNSVFIRTRWSF